MEDSFGFLRSSLPLHLCQIIHVLVSSFLFYGSRGRGSEKLASASSFSSLSMATSKKSASKKGFNRKE